MRSRRGVRWLVAGGVAAGAVLGAGAGQATAEGAPLKWTDCGDGLVCATALVPRDYDRPSGPTFELALVRKPAVDQANRIGSLFVNPGGPGDSGVEFLRQIAGQLAPLDGRFDIVSWDPRGVGASAPAVDCDVVDERDAPRSLPLPRPGDIAEAQLAERARRYAARCDALNGAILPHLSTADTARDLDRLRALVGDAKLTYAGFSYGTQIGAVYATLFPRRARALALDGAVNVEGLVEAPIRDFRETVAAHERALGRFLQTCAAHQEVCGFGGDDPWSVYDELLEAADASPIPAPRAQDPSPVTGDDIRVLSAGLVRAKQAWPLLAVALAQAAAGDASLFRELAGPAVPEPEELDSPLRDAYYAIISTDADWPRRVETYLSAGRHEYRAFDHFWWGGAYDAIPSGIWPAEAEDGYFGPVENPPGAATALVVGTTYDPATPYAWARELTGDLGNARLLTMRGDGHVAYRNGSPSCIDTAMEAYLIDLVLPQKGTVCRQEIPFEPIPVEGPSLSAARPPLAALDPWHRPQIGSPLR